jgi:putative protease
MSIDDDTFSLLIDSVRRFVRERLMPAEDVVEESDEVPADIIDDMRTMGLFGLSIPEAYGGIGLSLAQEVEVAYVLGHAALALAAALVLGGCAPAVQQALGKLGGTLFSAASVTLAPDAAALFVPLSEANALRRDVLAALEAARDAAFERLRPANPVHPPAPYPEDTLSYLANVYNSRAAAFYARHGVKLIAAAYESHEEPGEVSLMITKHCVRYSLSLCPKQAKGVTGVQGTVRAEPLVLQHGDERLTLRFDCKPCEMHVVGAMRPAVLRQAREHPVTWFRSRTPVQSPSPKRAT